MDKRDTSRDRVMWENSLAFFGAITASVSHELNNVMSIIDQNNGLLGDLLIGAEHGRPISNERIQRISDSLTNQVERGVRIIKRLNTFAHSVDDPVRQFDLVQLVDNFIRLAQRLASLKRVNLEGIHKDSALQVKTSPFLVQQVLFLCIQRCLNLSQAEDTIEIHTIDNDPHVEIEVRGRPPGDKLEEWDSAYFQQLLEMVNGNYDIKTAGDKEIIRLILSK